MGGIPGIPGPDDIRPDLDAKLDVAVRFPDRPNALSPANEDGLEAEINRRFREEGVAPGFTPMIQVEPDELLEAGGVPTVMALVFRFENSPLRFTQLDTAIEIILEEVNAMDLDASEEQVFIDARMVRTIGPD